MEDFTTKHGQKVVRKTRGGSSAGMTSKKNKTTNS